ncbi:MAG: thioredoxin family protein [bacterium]|jgi:thiol:disulfide interchange protein DsbD|nr:thioredoxin family protein [bacterium]
MKSARAALVPACARLFTLTLLVAAVPALALDLQVMPRTAEIEPGRDLVLDLVVTPADDEFLDSGSLQVKVTLPDAPGFIGEPYPLRVTPGENGALLLEWAAPVPGNAPTGEHRTEVTVTGATVDARALSASWQGTVTGAYGEGWSADRIQNFLDRRGLPFFLVLVFGFGLLMSLSPCIYPMIPITLAVIGARSQEKGALHGLGLSVTYVLGMALVYAVLGALSASVFSGITAFMQSPVVVAPIAVLLMVLAFSMFGAFELQAPAFLRDRLAGPGGTRGGIFGVFAMGLVAGLVASPCVGPFLAALLVWVATTGNWVLGFFSLLTFGLGMGMLLIGVGTFPALLGTLPRSGGWMDTVKKGMGLLLVVMAFWFVRPGVVLPAAVFYPLAGTAAILTAVFMGAFDRPQEGWGWWPRTRMALGLVIFVAGLWLLVGSFLAHGFLLPSPLQTATGPVNGHGEAAVVAAANAPRTSPATITATGSATPSGSAPATATADAGKVAWEVIATGANASARLEAIRAAAREAGQPVLVDFWASWCVYCKKLDKSVWNDPAVVAESQRWATVKMDATATDDDEMAAIKAEFQVTGLPRVIFIDSRGAILHARATGFVPAPEMLALMQSVR